jgi:hypothetical protein
MTGRDKAYLIAHNKRRIEWHSRYNKAYVPLKWSKGELSYFLFALFYVYLFLTHSSSLGLKDLSLVYAEKLLETCLTAPPDHESNNPYGENLARNKGSPDSFGQLYSESFVLSCFLIYLFTNN